ncbi:unnamed protein product, partial [Prorocentrum cordatum]
AQMQKAQTDLQRQEHNVENDLQRLARAKEQVLECEKALRESRAQLRASDEGYKTAFSEFKSYQEAEAGVGFFVDCDAPLLEDLVSAEVELEEADKTEYHKRRVLRMRLTVLELLPGSARPPTVSQLE